MDTPLPLTLETKLCMGCGNDRPIEQFRFQNKAKGWRHSQCNECNLLAEKERRRVRRLDRVTGQARKIASAKRHRNQVVALVAELYRSFGDAASIAGTMKAAYDRAMELGRPFTAIRVLTATLDLAIIAEQEQADQIREMTDEELHEAGLRSAEQLIQKRPEIAVLAAHRCGWRVEPVENTESEALEKPQTVDPA